MIDLSVPSIPLWDHMRRRKRQKHHARVAPVLHDDLVRDAKMKQPHSELEF